MRKKGKRESEFRGRSESRGERRGERRKGMEEKKNRMVPYHDHETF
jgi:hypothetical protein